MTTALQFTFWASAIILAYIYLGYPALIWLMARVRTRPVKCGPFTGRFSVVIVAHNEESVLARKLESVLAADGLDRLEEIVVVSDGSTDGTEEAASKVEGGKRKAEEAVRVVRFAERRGKAACLNDVIPQCKGGVVILTDARQVVDPRAFVLLLDQFADERVGVVSGELVLRGSEDDTATSAGMGAYWRYEKSIRKNESRYNSVPGATGALYAIRKDLFRPIPADTVLDDVAIPMQIVAGAHRCLFREGAFAFDDPSRVPGEEAARKRRTIAGNVQLLRLFPQWLCLGNNPIWWQYISHKMLRLTSPFLLILLAVANVALLCHVSFRVMFAMQIAFYLLAGLGSCVQRMRIPCGPFGIPFMFVSLNLITLAALWDAARGKYRVMWVRTCSHRDAPDQGRASG